MKTTKKVSVSIDIDLLEKTDKYADKHYMKRSAVLNLALSNLVLQDELTQALEPMRDLLIKANKDDTMSEADKKQAEQFQILCNAMLGELGKGQNGNNGEV